jgi:hypothetical protein
VSRDTNGAIAAGLSHKSDPRGRLFVRALRARAGLLLLINQLNLPERLKAYGPRFGSNLLF